MRRKRTLARGFSLVEVMVALFLLVVGALIYASSIPLANECRAKANHRNIAVSLAQKQIERVRERGYAGCDIDELVKDQPAQGRPKLVDSSSPGVEGKFPFTNIDFGQQDSAADVLPGGQAWMGISQSDIDLREVEILITWQEEGVERQVRAGTLVANL